MFTHKDIDVRSIFVINCIEHNRGVRVFNGELMLEEKIKGRDKTLTKIPFQKLLALFVIGNITITTPVIEKCKKFGVALVVMKPNLRPVVFFSDSAEANYLVRKKQYEFSENDISIGKVLVANKIANQQTLLLKTRKKDERTVDAIEFCQAALDTITDITDYNKLMGLEGAVSKCYFATYFQGQKWKGRCPRMKMDPLNVTLDIGYTILFNFIESFVRLFGFDIYIGVYHRLWFKRKSLICDLVEPFRCIVDHTTLLAFNRKQFSQDDFGIKKNEYYLKPEKCSSYYNLFFQSLITYKTEIFKYMQKYYRCFMGKRSESTYPVFTFK